MSLRFIKDIKEFYAHNPYTAGNLHDAAHSFETSLKAVCSDEAHLVENPHMIRHCCPPLRHLPKHANDDLRIRYEIHRDFCYGVHGQFNNILHAESPKVSHETRMHQRVVEMVTAEACKNLDFNRGHAHECCTSPGLLLGWTTDHEGVAKACGLARQ